MVKFAKVKPAKSNPLTPRHLVVIPRDTTKLKWKTSTLTDTDSGNHFTFVHKETRERRRLKKEGDLSPELL